MDKILANEEIRSSSQLWEQVLELNLMSARSLPQVGNYDRCRCRWGSHPYLASTLIYRFGVQSWKQAVYTAQPPLMGLRLVLH